MSYDITIGWREFNYTYNIEPMLRKAMGESTDIAIFGVILHEWTPTLGHWRGAIASEFAGALEGIIGVMETNRASFEQLNPPNGWGNYEGCLRWLKAMRDTCRELPDETVAMWL